MKTPRSAASRKRQVLIVDDHPLLRDGLARLINCQADLAVCGEAGTARAALTGAAKFKPDIAIVDISLPDRDGIALIKELHARHPAIPVLVLSMHSEQIYAERALRAGARGYTMKREPAVNHLRAIRQVLAGELAISSSIAAGIVNQMASANKRTPGKSLTNRELSVIRLLSEGQNYREIAVHLKLSTKTVESHRTNICKKLGLRGAAELLRQSASIAQCDLHPATLLAKR